MSVSVAIVNWNTGNRLRACVESLISRAKDSEIIVVDNASTDASLESIEDYRNQVDIIKNSVNRGFAAGVNQAVAHATTALVLILNPDVVVSPGSVEALEAFLNSHPKAGAAGGFVNEKYLTRKLPTTASLIREDLGFGSVKPLLGTNGPVRVEQPAAAALMIRRDAFDEISGFDERFFPAWYEDVDFCRRLREAGWEIYFVPTAKFEHEGGYSAEALGARGFANAYYRNQLRYVDKHFSFAGAALVRASIAIGMIVRSIGRPANTPAHLSVLKGALGGWR